MRFHRPYNSTLYSILEKGAQGRSNCDLLKAFVQIESGIKSDYFARKDLFSFLLAQCIDLPSNISTMESCYSLKP